MNYYPFNVGDYAAHTAHLEPMEDLAYRRLLDQYYLREGPLPADIQATAKLVRMRSMAADVESVLREFFTLTDDGWRHSRCDAEVEKMQDKQAKARASAAASVSVRQAKQQASVERALMSVQTDVERTLPDSPTDVELPTPTPTPTPTPEETKRAKALSSPEPTKAAPTVPCPYEAIVEAYHAALPSLPKVKLMKPARQKAMRMLWGWVLSSRKSDGERRATTAEEALAWLRSYFGHASRNDFLMGRTARSPEHAGWQCDLDFLLSDKGMKQVIEKTVEQAA